MNGEITVVIKTFERPAAARRCITFLREYDPTLNIIVIDDSRSPLDIPEVQHIRTPYDIGISKGRNLGISLVRTEFVLITDDDYFLRQESDIGGTLQLIKSGEADIVGPGNAFNFEPHGDILYIVRAAMGEKNWIRCDVVSNCFLARTEVLRRVPWRDRLKINEHAAFFLDARNAGVSVVASSTLSFWHAGNWGNSHYKRMRNRSFLHLYKPLYGYRKVLWKGKREN